MAKFAFVIHPIYYKDILKKFPFLEKCPPKLIQQIFKRLPPFKVSHIEGIESPYNATGGWFVACPLSSEQIMSLPEDFVMHKIIQAVRKAEKLGADIVGLGALTAVVGDAGETIQKHVDIPVTTGNSYTVATALEAVQKACDMMGYDYKQVRVAIIGASGSIGSVVAKRMAKDVRYLSLIGRNKSKLEPLAESIYQESGLAAKVSSSVKQCVSNADVVIAVTGAVDTVINGEELKPGAIVCDVARPRDVSWRVAETRDDVLVIEGGIVEVPGDVQFNFNFGFPPKTAYACMAETMILALENRLESYSLGRNLTVDQIDKMSRLATKHGFKLAGFRSFERAVDQGTIDRIKKNIKRGEQIATYHNRL